MDRNRKQALIWGACAVCAALALPAAVAARRARTRRRPSAQGRAARARPGAWVRLRGEGSPGVGSAEPKVQRWVFDAPRERVYAYWTAFTGFPDFMDSVEDVQETQPGCYRVRLRGPGGQATTWEAVLERLVPNEAVAWTSSPGSAVQCSGQASFLPLEGGGTLVELRLDYRGAAPWLAAGMENFLRAELPSLIARDVLRMKDLIETGSAEL